MKAKCIVDIDYFTLGKFYDVVEIDEDGDVWTFDDRGYPFFMFPEECEVIRDNA